MKRRAGGHANTVVHDGLALDTGFLVHNTQNYPLLCRLFSELGVRSHDSEMSFSVSCRGCGLEYSGRRPFAQLRNATSPRFHGLLWEIGRWLRTARRSLDEADYESSSLGDYLDERGYSRRFRSHFLVPLTAALWSTAPGRALEFPAAYAIRFFENHGMLGFGRFRWRTVTGGSRVYVGGDRRPARQRPAARPARCAAIRRGADGVEVRCRRRRDPSGSTRSSSRRTPTRRSRCSRIPAIRGAPRTWWVRLHDETRRCCTPMRRCSRPRAAARASWNYRTGNDGRPTLTYYLNKLQRLDAERDYCVTLNEDIADEHVLAAALVHPPALHRRHARAQTALRRLSGSRHTLYAGAHLGQRLPRGRARVGPRRRGRARSSMVTGTGR